MSTSPTTSTTVPDQLSITKGPRSKRLDELCNKYINKLVQLTSMDSIRKHFDEQDIEDAELIYASQQMTEYAESQLWESISTLFEEEHVYERLNHIDKLSEHKEDDYESVYMNSINQQIGEPGDKFHRVTPDAARVTNGVVYRVKREELERLHALRDSLRFENKASMDELNRIKQTRDHLIATPPLSFTPPQIDPS